MAEKVSAAGAAAQGENEPDVTKTKTETETDSQTQTQNQTQNQNQTQTQTQNQNQNQKENDDVEELLVHIKGIKFQHPDYGVKRITKAINQLGGKWENVKEKRVRKHMKKHGLLQSQLDEDNEKAGVLKFFTVGDSSKPHQKKSAPEASKEVMQDDSYLIELNVPGIRSGKRHQAVLSAPEVLKASNGDKEDNKTESTRNKMYRIYKIQLSHQGRSAPILLYNDKKTQKTFIHPDDKSFARIAELIEEHGIAPPDVPVAKKAYFYGLFNRNTGKNHVLILTDQVAPLQDW